LWSVVTKAIARLISDQRGLGTIEYALVASLISVAAIAGYESVGAKVESSYSNTQQAIVDNI
jgi:Flp pilus assembly pilin Flp